MIDVLITLYHLINYLFEALSYIMIKYASLAMEYVSIGSLKLGLSFRFCIFIL
jgi:hypothetical protein